MGNKFYRLKEALINLAIKFKLHENAKKVATTVVKNTEKLRTNGLSKKQTITISSLLIICLIIVLWPTKKIQSPISVVSEIETAIFKGDVSRTIQLVDIEALSKDMASSVIAQIESKKLTKDLLSYMQNELEEKITDDFYSIVSNKGNFYQNLDDKSAILSKTLNFLVDKTAKVINRQIIQEDEKSATVRLTVFRPEIEKEINIDLLLEYDGLSWSLVKIKDLATLIAELEQLEEQRIEKLNAQIKENFNNYIVLKDFQKSNLNVKENSFLIRVSLENISDEDVNLLEGTLRLVFKNQLIGSVNIKVEDNILANNFYEKAWSIKLNDYESLKNLAKIKSEDIKAVLDIEKLVFTEGNVIELIK